MGNDKHNPANRGGLGCSSTGRLPRSPLKSLS
jgi:hypothetical protein